MFEPEKEIPLIIILKFAKVFRYFFGVSAFLQKVELKRKVFLRFINEPLELEVGEQEAHGLYAIFHRNNVDFCIPPNVMMLNFDCNFLAIFQGCTMDLSQTRSTQWHRIKRIKKLRRL